MYFWQTAGVSVSQNCRIPSFNSGMVFGFILVCRKFFMDPHTFSMGLRSGFDAGVFHQLMSFSTKYCCAHRLVCLGSLSC